MSTIEDSSASLVADSQTRHLLLGLRLLFFAALAWCLILNHGPTAENDRISFYGVCHETVALLIGGYAAAFVGCVGHPRISWFREYRPSPGSD
jgi:hypothetical protein